MRRWLGACFLLGSLFPPAALAQSAPVAHIDPNVEVSGGFSYAKTWDDEGSIGKGTAFSGHVLFPLNDTISVGGMVARIPHDRETGSGSLRFQGDSTLVGATGKFTFGRARVRPFLMAGFGVLRYSGVLTSGPPTYLPPFGTPAPLIPVERFERRGTETFASGTSGVDVWITRHIAVRPSATLHMTQPNEDFMPWSIITGGIGMAVRW